MFNAVTTTTKKQLQNSLFKKLYSALDLLDREATSADMDAVPMVELEFYADTLMHMAVTLKFRLDDLTGVRIR